jgi:hypothetical protein
VLYAVVVALNTLRWLKIEKKTHNFERCQFDCRGVVVVGQCKIVAKLSLRRIHDFADDIQLQIR